ncbi:glycosyl transferase [Methylobacterium aerolatum]|uniref:UDP-N-acetylmuramyl pentapeptide phosphotransferase/UDP-N-acetylglucosamine-1-phosphate transferase n=1 Tax=Methylobacterium aerolatum TaxID=418708 RepID=A0ABU0I044_9HYPH|nr:glycosyl transferase [Methylobacterium aerolatum]MDQ0447967.1 UDP-N-acetylmuramyl pentapeptide phosphotransferase/UDP-N-acetylglucosamine-1-phosphate transferase [Methylobacterium aerolatum]GJD34327.1 putative undecaprenyl-phosphate N-acetylglucosaminyl 1-phosphate transferase [Methylobacterium aerolatum]
MTTAWIPLLAVPLSAALSAGLVLRLMPLLRRYALARPNTRSSHVVPTPQGGGIAVVTALVTVSGLLAGAPEIGPRDAWTWLAGGTLALAALGAVDDLRPLPALPRLAVQLLVVGLLVSRLDGRIVPEIPLWLERGLATLAGLWFVNLTNFMDGLDWMTVAEIVPVSAALVLLGLAGALPLLPTLVAAALLGAMLGFAPFNRPVAGLFLGDVGSLPIGLVTAWLLCQLALAGGLAAAILLPLVYLADASLTLAARAARRERVWEAHRGHFYQRATVNGLTVTGVVGRVFLVNAALAVLAAATVLRPSWPVSLAALALGGLLVAGLLRRFARPPSPVAGLTGESR